MITRTPLRVSLAGGGSDLPAFSREHGGAVVSMTIDLSMYVAVHERVLDSGYRIAYSKVEEVREVNEIEHGIVREALLAAEAGPCEIATICDAPAGTGLGSSAAVAVGLVNALGLAEWWKPEEVASRARAIEGLALGRDDVGFQDHVAAAYGGLRLYVFPAAPPPGFRPASAPVAGPHLLAPNELAELGRRLLLVPTGGQRDAASILGQISADAAQEPTRDVLGLLRDLALALATSLEKGEGLEAVKEALLTGWALKRELSGVTNAAVDALYDQALELGASAGKLLGAGGLGFLLLYVEPELQAELIEALPVKVIPVRPTTAHTKVIYSG